MRDFFDPDPERLKKKLDQGFDFTAVTLDILRHDPETQHNTKVAHDERALEALHAKERKAKAK